MARPRVLLYEDMAEEGKAILREKAEVVFAEKLDESYIAERAKDVDGIVIRANGNVTQKIMESAPRLKVVGRHGTGVENIDLQAATDLGIWVVNTPDANDQSVAEHFFGLALMLSRMLKKGDIAVREGRWEARYVHIGRELKGKTLGILGFGRIGKAIGQTAHKGFGMNVLYYDSFRFEAMEQEIKAAKVSLDDILSRSDFVSINLPMTPETKSLIGARELDLMKPTAYILNLARGPIWDEKALESALRDGKIAGAASDVFAVEPVTKDHALLKLDNFIATPHMAAHTQEALRRMSRVAEDIVRVLEGKEPLHPVNRPLKE